MRFREEERNCTGRGRKFIEGNRVFFFFLIGSKKSRQVLVKGRFKKRSVDLTGKNLIEANLVWLIKEGQRESRL